MKLSQKTIKKTIAIFLTIVMILTMLPVNHLSVSAATKKPKLSNKNITLTVGKKKTVTLKNVNKKVQWKIVFGKKNVSIKKSGKYKQKITVKAKKAGTAKIRAIYRNKKYVLKVKIKKKKTTVENKTIENSTVVPDSNTENKTETNADSNVYSTEKEIISDSSDADQNTSEQTPDGNEKITGQTPNGSGETTGQTSDGRGKTTEQTPNGSEETTGQRQNESDKTTDPKSGTGDKIAENTEEKSTKNTSENTGKITPENNTENLSEHAGGGTTEKGTENTTEQAGGTTTEHRTENRSENAGSVTTEHRTENTSENTGEIATGNGTGTPSEQAGGATTGNRTENTAENTGEATTGNGTGTPSEQAGGATTENGTENTSENTGGATTGNGTGTPSERAGGATTGNGTENTSENAGETATGNGTETTSEEQIIEDTTQEEPTIPDVSTEEVFYEEPEMDETPVNIDNIVERYMSRVDVASSSVNTNEGEGIENLFDGDLNTKMCTGDAAPIRIAWQMERAIVLRTYTLITANDSEIYSYRNPIKWHLYGSNNGTSWTQIDTVTDSGIEAKNFGRYTYETDVQESFQYFLLQLEDNGGYYGYQLAELEMSGDVASVSEEIGENLSVDFESVYENGTTAEGYENQIPAYLFDGDVTTKYFENTKACSIAWKMDKDTTLYSYGFTTADDNATYNGRNPKAWILYGSKDGENWDKIDVVNESEMEDVNFKTYHFTVDRVSAYRYYKLDIKASYGDAIQLSEISLKGASVSTSKYDILFTGDWDLVESKGYVDELVKLFYNSYPRLYKRWGTGTEPTTITFMADKDYDGVAYCLGTTVCVSVDYANANPTDIGFFSHEITHSVQQYGGLLNYGDDVFWWTENMANYGGFRYFHWSNPQYVQVYEASDPSLQDWGYQNYGNNKWFFAYMDARYPSRKNADGSISYGLIDSINNLIKNNKTGQAYSDDPRAVGSPFNDVVKEITGYDCIESLRLRYVEELQQGTWTFRGFADYEDNWITEDIEGIPNPEYPMLGDKIHGNIVATRLETAVTNGTNLCEGASVYDCSGYISDAESPQMLIDGNPDTKWCARNDDVKNGTYKLNGVAHWVQIDLGEQKTFNTYTIYNTRSREGYNNMSEWEILISDDAKNWSTVDYQVNNNGDIVSFDIGQQNARYVMMKVFNTGDAVGTLRLYDFQIYNR